LGAANVGKQQRYVNIFNDLSEDWEIIVKARHTEREADFIRKVMLKRGITLDLCCGTGRHSILLSKKGWRIFGLDLSKNLLAIAKRNMKDAGVYFSIVRGDMRSFPFRSQVFNGAVSMFTSFGYLPSESEDKRSLTEVWRTLKNNGKFLLDVANRNHLINMFQEREWAEFESFYLLEKRTLDIKQSRLMSEWTVIRKNTGEVRKLQHNVRLYALSKLKPMLNKVGLKVTEIYGGYEKQRFNDDSTRMIVLAEKTK
jgi:ubiquinone/menaquinone biosynthesis C-methylase UbiE